MVGSGSNTGGINSGSGGNDFIDGSDSCSDTLGSNSESGGACSCRDNRRGGVSSNNCSGRVAGLLDAVVVLVVVVVVGVGVVAVVV